MRIKLHSVI